MNASQKKLLALIEEGQESTLLSRMSTIKSAATAAMVPALLQRWRKTPNGDLAAAVYQLLLDIKDEQAVPLIFQALENDDFANHRAELTALLWQTGLNVSGYFQALIDLALLGEYMTTLEVSTVIENLETEVPEDMLSDALIRIQEAIDQCDEENMLNLLENLKELVNQLYSN